MIVGIKEKEHPVALTIEFEKSKEEISKPHLHIDCNDGLVRDLVSQLLKECRRTEELEGLILKQNKLLAGQNEALINSRIANSILQMMLNMDRQFKKDGSGPIFVSLN